jgi:hypothetical protein
MVEELAERAYFRVCLVLGWLLRSARYTKVRTVHLDRERRLGKRRVFYAPFLISMGDPLFRLLDTGVRVLRQQDWEARERLVYQSLERPPIRIDGGMLVLPWIAGATLATVLEDPRLDAPVRRRAIELAVRALADFHQLGFTHGDAMAANVMVDLDAGVAHWFDFETVHDSSRSMAWRRADDVRALLVTCLGRSGPETLAETLQRILDVYGDDDVDRHLAMTLALVRWRPLAFHLAQAACSYRRFKDVSRLLNERIGV